MWTERPKMWTDGLIMATAMGLVMGLIVSIGCETERPSASHPQCQEVVVLVHQGEEILAQCPQGTWLDVVDGVNVVCRCGERRTPKWFERTPSSPPPEPQADPPKLFDGKHGTEI